MTWTKLLPSARPTLQRRLTTSISLLTVALFLLFSATTLFVTYSLEDAVYQEQLKQAQREIGSNSALPANMDFVEDLTRFNIEPAWPVLSVELGENTPFGEFTADGRHYHYRVVDGGFLLLDSTDIPIVKRALDDIFLILLVILLPALLITLWVARITSKHALKPFRQLSQMFIDRQPNSTVDAAQLNQIREQDVKQIACELLNALEQKAEVLEQQVAFSQGMAHELRTPLQVMTHSLELLGQTHDGLPTTSAFTRLTNSVTRMQRISSGLLWLTSTQDFSGNSDVEQTVRDTLGSLEALTVSHGIDIRINCHRPCEMPLPSEVLELIVINLLNNVIHHGKADGGQMRWDIEIDSRRVLFSNAVENVDPVNQNEQRFGVGLVLVEKLVQRFELAVDSQTEGDRFSIVISRG
ncbi:sensor histidine kinase [Parahaliea mediterranea]|uniref:histidine kinase n=1 Tax=Parahaliea mediterranea TaxID=651086 RepID=A0A939DEV0_9GAMM|nr:HAMP domain-containing sensor histidine kinase [Parahaliea mediterranea]MBN7796943.1 HAMP domain-containing histidine kinase [Parahaliea mediterranea]